MLAATASLARRIETAECRLTVDCAEIIRERRGDVFVGALNGGRGGVRRPWAALQRPAAPGSAGCARTRGTCGWPTSGVRAEHGAELHAEVERVAIHEPLPEHELEPLRVPLAAGQSLDPFWFSAIRFEFWKKYGPSLVQGRVGNDEP